jgi:N12 class adenine-specific DNA methylase
MFIKLLFNYRGEWTQYRETFGSLRSKILQNRQKCQFKTKSEKRSRKIINL